MDQRKQTLLTGIILVCVMCVLLIIYTATQHHSERAINNSKTKSNKRDNVSSIGQENKAMRKENLLNYFKSLKIKNNKTIAGAWFDYSENINNTVPHIGGNFPAILTMAIPHHSSSADEWQQFVNNIILKWNNGYLVHIIWGLHQNPITTKAKLNKRNDTLWTDLSTEDGELNKVWKNDLDKLAPYLRQLLNAGVVPICDILPCINHNDRLWNGRPGTNGSLKLYQMTYDYLKIHHGLSSIVWVWSIYGFTSLPSIEEYWPGNDYVDVASFYMGSVSQLNTSDYQKILSLVGDKPISMEWMDVVPSIQLLAAQSRWTWFTLNEYSFRKTNVNPTFSSSSVITRENNEYFNPMD